MGVVDYATPSTTLSAPITPDLDGSVTDIKEAPEPVTESAAEDLEKNKEKPHKAMEEHTIPKNNLPVVFTGLILTVFLAGTCGVLDLADASWL